MTAKEPIEQKLKKLAKAIGTDDSLVENVMNRIDAEPSRTNKSKNKPVRRFIMNRFTKLAAAAVIIIAAVLSISIFDKTIPTASAAQVLQEAARAVSNLRSVYIEAKMRTRSHDNFASIQISHGFVPLQMWKQTDENGILRWRIEKPDRVAAMDGETATLLIRNSWASQGNCPDFWCFDLHWLGQLLNIDGLLESELKKVQQQTDAELCMRHENTDGRELLVIEIYTPAKGDFINDYMKNKFISNSDHTCIYHFDRETKFLEGFEIYVHTGNQDVLIFEITNIEYNLQVDDNLFVLDLPDKVIWLDSHPETLPNNEKYENMTPKETAAVFFKAFAEQNWDEAAKFWELSKDKRVRAVYGDLEIISLGEPFKSGTSKGWFVPYEIKLKDGTVKKHNLAVHNDNPAKRYVVDGGL